MDELSPKDQNKLHDLLQQYDQLIEQMGQNSSEIDPESAEKLYDLYDAMSKILKSAQK
jgi:hypothetical protein